MAVDSSEQPFMQVRDFCSVLVLTDEDMGSVHCESQLALSTYIAVDGSQMRSDASVASQNTPDVCKHSASAYCPSAANMDIEKGNLDKVIVKDEIGGGIQTDITLTKALRRQNSLQPAGESIQPVMNHILMLLNLDSKDKQAMERAHDAPNTRCRKYKRPSVFDSRQIVLLFSIMSSMGTIVLIYLTLRVRQAGEGLALT